MVLLFTSQGAGLAPKTWKTLSSVKNETSYGAPLVAMSRRQYESFFVVKLSVVVRRAM